MRQGWRLLPLFVSVVRGCEPHRAIDIYVRAARPTAEALLYGVAAAEEIRRTGTIER